MMDFLSIKFIESYFKLFHSNQDDLILKRIMYFIKKIENSNFAYLEESKAKELLKISELLKTHNLINESQLIFDKSFKIILKLINEKLSIEYEQLNSNNIDSNDKIYNAYWFRAKSIADLALVVLDFYKVFDKNNDEANSLKFFNYVIDLSETIKSSFVGLENNSEDFTKFALSTTDENIIHHLDISKTVYDNLLFHITKTNNEELFNKILNKISISIVNDYVFSEDYYPITLVDIKHKIKIRKDRYDRLIQIKAPEVIITNETKMINEAFKNEILFYNKFLERYHLLVHTKLFKEIVTKTINLSNVLSKQLQSSNINNIATYSICLSFLNNSKHYSEIIFEKKELTVLEYLNEKSSRVFINNEIDIYSSIERSNISKESMLYSVQLSRSYEKLPIFEKFIFKLINVFGIKEGVRLMNSSNSNLNFEFVSIKFSEQLLKSETSLKDYFIFLSNFNNNPFSFSNYMMSKSKNEFFNKKRDQKKLDLMEQVIDISDWRKISEAL